ncbi:MAG: L,D-transpeptidase family protein [Alphaproteobacteria bacterium]|nr:L,D-transpeptidase family protein [Alphaproteobacteria bacterium]
MIATVWAVFRNNSLAFVLWAIVAGFPGTAWAGHFSALIEERLSAEATSGNPGPELLTLQRFYEARQFEPAWIEHDRPGVRARALVKHLVNAEDHGLEPADYATNEIVSLLDADSDPIRAELDVRLSRAVLEYGNDLASGRLVPTEVDKEVFIEPKEVDPFQLLTEATQASDLAAYLEGLAPDTPQYRRLRAALAKYREIADRGGWNPVDGGDTLKPGMTDPRVAQLRERLVKGGYMAADGGAPEVYDEALKEAVVAFQAHHGLTPDGAVGKKTVAALNVPAQRRVRQMELNMERRRWMPDELGRKYVFVNMADFELKVVDGPKTIHVTRVVVGKPFHRTPVMSAKMTYLVLNPYWHVPPSIARKELLPKIKKDPGYLRQKNIRVLSDWSANATEVEPMSVNWSQIKGSSFRYKLRQDAGDDNALGRVKFMFPNRHSIYLHDTPSKSLFNRTVRSFSHGCIRVENPLDLAELLLEPQGGWDRQQIDEVVASGERQIVRLQEPIPVYLTYLTAWANKNGTINFRPDIYDRDERLAGALDRARNLP